MQLATTERFNKSARLLSDTLHVARRCPCSLASSALQSDVPVIEEDTYRRGDIVTSVAGLAALPPTDSPPNFESQTQLITDLTIMHPYTWTHAFKPNSLRDAETLKNSVYFSSYQTWCMLSLQLLWSTGARNATIPMVSGRLSSTTSRVITRFLFAAYLPGVVDEHQLYQRSSNYTNAAVNGFFRKSLF